MGSCTSKQQLQQQQSFHHERFDEYDDAYFERVETRNSFDSRSSSKWWRKYKIKQQDEDTPLVVDGDDNDDNDYDPNHNNSTNSYQRYYSRTSSSMETNSLMLTTTTTMPTMSVSTTEVTSPTTTSDTFDGSPNYAQSNTDERHVKGWHVKRKGHALQLRLAKHRFLQLAVTQQQIEDNKLISPLSMDSAFSVDSPETSSRRENAIKAFPGSDVKKTTTAIAKPTSKPPHWAAGPCLLNK